MKFDFRMDDEEAGDPDPCGRLRSNSFTSGLSINEFAAGASLGLEPLQFVQGYSVLAQSSPLYSGGVSMTGRRFLPTRIGPCGYTMNGHIRNMAAQGYWKRYRCPHVHQVITQ